ncbi:MAG: hypothetical protein AABZ32_02995 [Bacteroidota bacterium]
MKKIFFISVFLSIGSSFFSSCHCKKKTTTDTVTSIESKRDFEKEGYTKATVIFYELDACKYLLQLEDQKKLDPSNLSADFQKDHLAVWIKYALKKDAVSACMAGQIVDLSDIHLRK